MNEKHLSECLQRLDDARATLDRIGMDLHGAQEFRDAVFNLLEGTPFGAQSDVQHDGLYGRLRAALKASASPSDDGARQPQDEQLDAETAKTLRAYLWLGHGHQGQYGDDGEMQCSACAPIWDYRRAPLADVIQQAAKARQEVNMAALFKQVDPPKK